MIIMRHLYQSKSPVVFDNWKLPGADWMFQVPYRLRDQGSPVDVLYINFSKTFDKDPHARLASKILAYGITGKIL
ncbi:putative reverse transcriptase-like, partial [Homarus americanus]